MSRPRLRLVHDASNAADGIVKRNVWASENARQLSLFEDDDRDCLYLVKMNDMDRFRFQHLLDAKKPSSILDTRRYPDFFGLFRSTQNALSYFDTSSITYLHAPLIYSDPALRGDSWTFRSNIISNLDKITSESSFVGSVMFVLVPSNEVLEKCGAFFRSLPAFERKWKMEQYSIV
ncbi:hypothetical protein A8A54_01985 [Brucella pseudogrignonensis]|uniref:hypothetical protein n=1 Tax=Brucella pseudogrignonensis TaxID=419475 RepID=UPI0007DA74B8|nr:hypothetical protein [Brucella pseudogrignonensis]ANG95367.1 hypothetical protein A8A54_01985 [Brucella pseudogrignonensis]